MINKLRIAILSLTALASSAAFAQEKKDIFNPVNTSVTSQTIAPDARSAGMGDVGVATDPDVNSQYWNPAKYPFNISRAGCLTELYALAPPVSERYRLSLPCWLLSYR